MKHLLLILLLALLGLQGAADDRTIVSLSPALTEILCFLGGEARLAARSGGCNYPESVKKLPVAGSLGTPDLERVALSRAGILLTDHLRNAALRRSLEELGVEVRTIPLARLEDYPAAVTAIGHLLGAEARAEAEVKRFRDFLAAARKEPGPDAPKVLFVVWHDPVIAAGGDTFATDYIRLAGGENVASGVRRAYFRPSPEWVLRHEPDLIVYPGGHGVSENALPPYWRELRAVRTGALYRPPEADIFFRLSPRFDRAVAGLETLLQDYRRRTRPADRP